MIGPEEFVQAFSKERVQSDVSIFIQLGLAHATL